jgi:ParB-like chromosome segregation protein Spo0J
MKIEYLDPKTLKPYFRNPKHHPERQIEELARMIEVLGFDQPIVVDKKLVIIKGHGRLLAALKLGLDVVPVIIRDISATDAKFLRVADNEVNTGDWDSAALRLELRELSQGGADLSLTGFELSEQQALMADLPPRVAGALLIPTVETTHECDKCGYRW